jgi:hypothetical protein
VRVLIGCEFSGIVRNEFIKRGHDAISCDLLPTESPGPHYQGDIFDVINDGWDVGIFFPPCTFLCSSGLHWNKRKPERKQETEKALVFVKKLLAAPIKRKALENPVGCISSRIRKPDQIIQPHFFGHPESKTTCLWLEQLPPLLPTCVLDINDFGGRWKNQTASGQNKLAPSPDRWKIRSATYPGIAAAMAEQWGK